MVLHPTVEPGRPGRVPLLANAAGAPLHPAVRAALCPLAVRRVAEPNSFGPDGVAEQKLGEGDTTYVTYVKKAGEAKPTPFVVDSSITPDYEASFPTVPPDQVLVLGDNRPGSCDAHVWLERGAEFTPQSNVIGQAELIYWPITRVRFLS